MKKKLIFGGIVLSVMLLGMTSCQKEKDPPTCDFTYNVNGLTVTFTAVVTNTDSYSWDFGDGETSTEANPVHTFVGGGDYDVELTVTGEGGTKSKAATITVTPNLEDIKVMLSGGPSDSDGKTWVLKTTATEGDGGGAINQSMMVLFPIPADFFNWFGSEKNDGKKDEFTFKYNGSYSINTRNDTSIAITLAATLSGLLVPDTQSPNGTSRISGYVQPASATWALNESDITVNAISPDALTTAVPPNLADVIITGKRWLHLSAGSFLGFYDFSTSTNLIIKSISPTEMQVAMMVCLFQGVGAPGGTDYANKPNLMFHMTFLAK